MIENWKKIEGFEYYMISDNGNVKSLKRNIILKPRKGKYGYLYLNLYNNLRKTVKIHRLVALNFIDNPLNLTQVNHIDEDKTNNNISNLEWCSPRYNKNFSIDKTKTTSKYRNVQWHKRDHKWDAGIYYKYHINIGRFTNEEDIYYKYHINIGRFTNEEDANQAILNFKKENNII